MSTHSHSAETEVVGRSRRLSAGAIVAALGTCALLLGACSSSSSSSSSSSTSTSASATLESLQHWPTSTVALEETGSSLLYPLFNVWVVQTEKQWPNVSVTTAATGSGTGVSQAAAGTVAIGASDAYLSPAQVAKTLANCLVRDKRI
jgi:phosphate transport system substrate-binding protein